MRPDVTRVRLFGGRCACCGARATAAAPGGLEPGSPFGRRVEAVVVYLHYAHAIGLEGLRALSMGRRRGQLRDSTLKQHRYDLARRLDRIVAHAVPQSREGETLRRRIGRCREHLTVFATDRDVPATNCASKRALRPSVVFRKATNGFRSEWGAETYAEFRSVVSTAKARGDAVLQAVRDALRHEAASVPG